MPPKTAPGACRRRTQACKQPATAVQSAISGLHRTIVENDCSMTHRIVPKPPPPKSLSSHLFVVSCLQICVLQRQESNSNFGIGESSRPGIPSRRPPPFEINTEIFANKPRPPVLPMQDTYPRVWEADGQSQVAAHLPTHCPK